MKFGWEKGIFEENVFSNICSTHKNAPKKYPPILKFEKKKNMTCPSTHVRGQGLPTIHGFRDFFST